MIRNYLKRAILFKSCFFFLQRVYVTYTKFEPPLPSLWISNRRHFGNTHISDNRLSRFYQTKQKKKNKQKKIEFVVSPNRRQREREWNDTSAYETGEHAWFTEQRTRERKREREKERITKREKSTESTHWYAWPCSLITTLPARSLGNLDSFMGRVIAGVCARVCSG